MRNYDAIRKPRVGATTTAKNGLMMTIIAWRNVHDIDVQFEDGTIVYHKHYRNFLLGTIGHPNYKIDRKDDRVGLTSYANNGMKITIIHYRSVKDMDVMCEDGTIIPHQAWGNFYNSRIRYPGTHRNFNIQQKYNGKSYLLNSGILLTVVDYCNSRSIKVKCDTGYTTVLNHSRSLNCKFKHPFPYQIGSVSMDKPAYIYNGVGNFYCHCTKCGLEDIMTVQEMKEHRCN